MERKIKKLSTENWQFESKVLKLIDKIELKEEDIINITESRGKTTIWFWIDRTTDNKYNDLWDIIEW
jgi:hypothetical protein